MGNLNSFDRVWLLAEITKLAGICIVIAFVFYDSTWGIIAALPVCGLLFIRDKRAASEKKKEQMVSEFKDVLVMLSGELTAGRSLETALVRLSGSYNGSGPAADSMRKELEIISHGLTLSRPPEQLIEEMGERNDIGEISEFSGLIRINKHYGGDIAAISARTAESIADRQMLYSEVRSLVAAKKLESLVMTVTPFAIIVYMRLTNPGYMEIMYDSLAGRIVMTVCLMLVLLAAFITDSVLSRL